MPFVSMKVIEGVFSPAQKEQIIQRVTEAMSNAYTRLGLSGRGARAAGASLIGPGSAPRW